MKATLQIDVPTKDQLRQLFQLVRDFEMEDFEHVLVLRFQVMTSRTRLTQAITSQFQTFRLPPHLL